MSIKKSYLKSLQRKTACFSVYPRTVLHSSTIFKIFPGYHDKKNFYGGASNSFWMESHGSLWNCDFCHLRKVNRRIFFIASSSDIHYWHTLMVVKELRKTIKINCVHRHKRMVPVCIFMPYKSQRSNDSWEIEYEVIST